MKRIGDRRVRPRRPCSWAGAALCGRPAACGPSGSNRSPGMTFGLVPAGTFQMGTPLTETGAKRRKSRTRVTLTKSFYLGRHEVTQAQWTAVMGTNPSRFQGCDACPVERVSLHDVDAFMARLNERSGPGFRLPTEAEWEKACRAGGAEPFGRTATLGSADANIDGHVSLRRRSRDRAWNNDAGRPVPRRTRSGCSTCRATSGSGRRIGTACIRDRPVTDPRGVCSSEYASSAAAAGPSTATAPAAASATRIGRRIPGYSLGFRIARTTE